ncbi:MAG: hypothetical protein ACREJN_06630, partial [Nitrospiraceae bacterium]
MGAIKGADKIRKINLSTIINKTKKERITQQLGQSIILLIVLAFVPFSWYQTWMAWTEGNYFLVAAGSFLGLASTIAVSGGVIMLSQSSRSVPAGLESFYTDPRSLSDID